MSEVHNTQQAVNQSNDTQEQEIDLIAWSKGCGRRKCL